MPITELAKMSPGIAKDLLIFLGEFNPKNILHLNNPVLENFECSYVWIWVHKIKVRAIIDSGAPGNIISTKLVNQLKLLPDIDHSQSYGTAGLSTTTSLGAYSALLLRFGSIQVAAPAIVLPNKSYDFLIGTLFLDNFKANIEYKTKTFNLMGVSLPMTYSNLKENEPLPKIVNIVFF